MSLESMGGVGDGAVRMGLLRFYVVLDTGPAKKTRLSHRQKTETERGTQIGCKKKEGVDSVYRLNIQPVLLSFGHVPQKVWSQQASSPSKFVVTSILCVPGSRGLSTFSLADVR